MPGLYRANQKLSCATPVKPASGDQELSHFLSNCSVDVAGLGAKQVRALMATEGARPYSDRAPCATSQHAPSPPAHPSNRVITGLNVTWRVVDDALQWILQRRKGNPRKKNSGWQDRSFCRTREGLLRSVRELCGEVDPKAMAPLNALPEFHSVGGLPPR